MRADPVASLPPGPDFSPRRPGPSFLALSFRDRGSGLNMTLRPGPVPGSGRSVLLPRHVALLMQLKVASACLRSVLSVA